MTAIHADHAPSQHETRRVVLLETDERAGLVASLAAACARHGVSLEITTGPGHVLISFAAEEAVVARLLPDLSTTPGVTRVSDYMVGKPRVSAGAAW